MPVSETISPVSAPPASTTASIMGGRGREVGLVGLSEDEALACGHGRSGLDPVPCAAELVGNALGGIPVGGDAEGGGAAAGEAGGEAAGLDERLLGAACVVDADHLERLE